MGKGSVAILCLIILSTAVFAIEARAAGMGNLSLLFPDDFHKYDLYDYAGIPAALMQNDSSTFTAVRLSGLQETWRHDSLRYMSVGEAFPQKLIDNTPLQALSGIYGAIPVFTLSPADFVYSSCQNKTTYDDFGNTKKPQAWRFYGNYGMLTQSRLGDTLSQGVKTPGFSFAYAKPASANLNYGLSGDFFYSMFTSDGSDVKATLMPVGAGGGIALNNKKICAGINAEYHYPMFKYSETFMGETYSESFNGHAVTPTAGLMIKSKIVTWTSAANFTWMSLAGKADGGNLGTLKIIGYSGSTSALLSRGLIRTVVFGRYDTRTPEYADSGGYQYYKTVYTNLNGGAGLGICRGQLAAGIEGSAAQNQIDDELNDEILKGRDLNGRFGVEYRITPGYCARGGFNYGIYDPDLDNTGDKVTSQLITAGFGITAVAGLRLDIAYNYRTATIETDPNEKITDHIVLLYFKYLIPAKKGMF